MSGMEVGHRGYGIGDAGVAILAYADDLCLVAETREQLQRMLDRAYEYAQWTGLRFRPNKCATLSVNNGAPRHFVENYYFLMGSESLPVLKWEDHYRRPKEQEGEDGTFTKTLCGRPKE